MYVPAPLLDKLPLGPMRMQDLQEGQNIGINKIFFLNINSIGQQKKKDGQNQPTNQHPNTWCGNCKSYGHLVIESHPPNWCLMQ
jgi:hypothetical protein